MSTRAVHVGGLLVLVAGMAGAMAAPMLGGVDYTAIPPDPNAMERQLKSVPINLTKAIGIAEGKVRGVARSAEIVMNGSTPMARVETFASGARQQVTVELQSGKVTGVEQFGRFPGAPVEGEWTETESGLKYFDIVKGTGPTPQSPVDKVTVHYTGWFVDGEKFDSSVDRGEPTEFPLNRVIAGWTEGVGSMAVGGKRKLVIPYDLAYGAHGRPPRIPAKATLIFDVELLDVQSLNE